MIIRVLICFLFFVQTSCAQSNFNINAEQIDPQTKMPKGWGVSFSPDQKTAYPVILDYTIKQSGKHSFSIEKKGKQAEFGAVNYKIDSKFEGTNLELRGYIKTKDVNTGYAGLWMRVDGPTGVVAFDNMDKSGLKGTTDWKEYTIKLPYDHKTASTIIIGGLIVGDGQVWFDNFQLFLDGKPINQAPVKQVDLAKAEIDTAFSTHSGINNIVLNPQVKKNLFIAGQFWGFLKYHHPAIAAGDYNWDAELFRFLPKAIRAKNNAELSNILEQYLDKLPQVTAKEKSPAEEKDVVIKPDYGELINGTTLAKSLSQKLLDIKNSSHQITEHYYIGMETGVRNPKFKNEKPYANMAYPDQGYRLLSLYRYWTMINYFFPYKDIIGTDWNKVLEKSLPGFVNAKDTKEYTLNVLRLIANINDTHANIWGSNPTLNEFKGKYRAPFKAEFIENKLVVTGYYQDTLDVKNKFKIGDVILSINGKPTEKLISEYLPITAASNYDTQLRDLPSTYLLRGNSGSFKIGVLRNGKRITQDIQTVNQNVIANDYKFLDKTAFSLLDNQIGYIYPGKYKNTDLDGIKTLFKDTKGIIIDMRCYPSEFMPFTFGSYIKPGPSPFVRFTKGSISYPGRFTYTQPLSNGIINDDSYKGKIVVIVNSQSQSQAEYTTMAFQSSPNVKVIGSTTAGADGNVSAIILPGGINTMISGIGVFYPDNTGTQRIGVKIDQVIKPTIKGIMAGRDELLEKAKEMIK